jgi:putative endonuclease
MEKQPAVYILASKEYGTLYTGVTSNLAQRIYQHKDKALPDSFSAKYACALLVFYELHSTMELAIAREKQIKAGSRNKKLALIKEMNPGWKDLYQTIL